MFPCKRFLFRWHYGQQKKLKLRFLCITWPTITQFDALQITPSAAREIPCHTHTHHHNSSCENLLPARWSIVRKTRSSFCCYCTGRARIQQVSPSRESRRERERVENRAPHANTQNRERLLNAAAGQNHRVHKRQKTIVRKVKSVYFLCSSEANLQLSHVISA